MRAMSQYSIPEFHPKCGEALNSQIEISMTVAYFYMAMVYILWVFILFISLLTLYHV